MTCTDCQSVDDNGHGTHLASIVGGMIHGVAKKSNLVAVKVLDASGHGSVSELIAGLNHIHHQHLASPEQTRVVLVGFAGGHSTALNTAVRVLTDAGVHVVVAAGNDGGDACDSSPASEKTAITVGATEDTSNTVTEFSNTGKCVDLFAPGRAISGAGLATSGAPRFSGTQQAAAHVAGAIALIIAEHGTSRPAEMARDLVHFATKGVIAEDSLKGSQNVLVRVPPQKPDQ